MQYGGITSCSGSVKHIVVAKTLIIIHPLLQERTRHSEDTHAYVGSAASKQEAGEQLSALDIMEQQLLWATAEFNARVKTITPCVSPRTPAVVSQWQEVLSGHFQHF